MRIITYSLYKKSLPLMLAVVLGVAGCTGSSPSSYVPNYHSALGDHSDSNQSPSSEDLALWKKFQKMEKVFADLKDPNLAENIRGAYAEDVYFNDTFHTFNNREEIVSYLSSTADKVTSTTTEFMEIGQSNDSYFLRWNMRIEFELNGKDIVTDSIGVTQIKFNDDGEVIFHQDFWDNTEGFFRHLPVVGFVLDRALSRL